MQKHDFAKIYFNITDINLLYIIKSYDKIISQIY